MSFDVGRAIARLVRVDKLREAEQNAAWVIRRSKTTRIRSKNEREPQHHDALSCFHERSYTLPCAKCRRSVLDAERNLQELKRKLSIT